MKEQFAKELPGLKTQFVKSETTQSIQVFKKKLPSTSPKMQEAPRKYTRQTRTDLEKLLKQGRFEKFDSCLDKNLILSIVITVRKIVQNR